MNTLIFEVKPLSPQSFMQRLLGQFPEENAILEFNNLLATQPIRSITPEDVARIESKHGLSLSKTFALNLEEFYAVTLNYFLQNQEFTPDERQDLAHLKTVLKLKDSAVETLSMKIGEQVYRQHFRTAVADGRLTLEKKEVLTRLEQITGIPEAVARQIAQEVRGERLQEVIASISADARLTPAEESELAGVKKDLGLEPDEETRKALARYKLYWQLENEPLPVVEVDIPLQKGEQCHLHLKKVEWYEERATARRNSYDDYYLWSHSMEKMDLNSNSSNLGKATFAILKRIAFGDVYVTSKRVIFSSLEKSTSFKFDGLIELSAFIDGVELNKLTGRNPIFLLKKDADLFALIMRRLFLYKEARL